MSHITALPMATVLVVEDNSIIRLAAVQIVEDAGYLVLESMNSADAIEMLETHEEISIVFTDIEMPPGMDGLGLAQVVHDRWPLVSLVVASGRIRPGAGDMPENTAFLPKPYSAAQVEGALAA